MSSVYGWQQLHQDLEDGQHLGTYGADNAPYQALACLREGVNMANLYKTHSPDEFHISAITSLIDNPQIRLKWINISSFDPLGIYATRPTISATEAQLTIPELQFNNELKVDSQGVVNSDQTLNCVKCAIEYVWNLPLLAKKLDLKELDMRQILAESTANPSISSDTTKRAYLPPVRGCTLYLFGDIKKLAESSTEVAVRVHDECNGSDVFGTDLCTCRSYLVFAIQTAVQVAQNGGVGIICYFKKEGRCLGEVIKFRVCNARKGQKGGDTPDNYFKQTVNVAGIEDARIQEIMPDVLLWLGVSKVDKLLSMNADKYEAIIASGIEVKEQLSLPDRYISKAATVEITAKLTRHGLLGNPDTNTHQSD